MHDSQMVKMHDYQIHGFVLPQPWLVYCIHPRIHPTLNSGQCNLFGNDLEVVRVVFYDFCQQSSSPTRFSPHISVVVFVSKGLLHQSNFFPS